MELDTSFGIFKNLLFSLNKRSDRNALSISDKVFKAGLADLPITLQQWRGRNGQASLLLLSSGFARFGVTLGSGPQTVLFDVD